ncbi:Tetraspanin [Meloidogyne graminicola]|uniref:Tetraspanin n=1 Tax=Meloidogyne graminicola TaxID=189291 RepID=A0A8S9ZHE7_9BILA|nr:Tetraspanin [Meloidogyne graminicola]
MIYFSGSSSENIECHQWSKYTLFGANIMFMAVGCIVLAAGVWLRTDSHFRGFLSERYRQAVHEAFWEAPTLYAFSYILIVLGCALIISTIFGCYGAATNSKLLLCIYGISTFALLIFTLGCGSYIIYNKDSIDVELADALNYMVQHYYQGPGIVQESLDRLQQAFRCCGNAGCSDFRVFRQDPPRTCDLRCDGCHYRIWIALRIGFSVALAIFALVILSQLVAISLSLTMILNDQQLNNHLIIDNTLRPFAKERERKHRAIGYVQDLTNHRKFTNERHKYHF